jgi:hypothetical protein
MTLQQTVTIPADRRVYFDLPETARIGPATLIIEFPTVPQSDAQTPALPPKPKDAPPGCNFWQDRVRPGEDPFAWHNHIGAFTGPSVEEFLADRRAETEREEAKFDAMFGRKQEQPE